MSDPRALLVSRSSWAMLALVAAAVFAPLLASHDPMRIDPGQRLLPPSAEHWFGTDNYGMDIWARVLHGARKDLLLAFVSSAAAMVVGAVLGGWGGYRGGPTDAVLQRATEVLQAFPVVLFAMAVLTALGASLVHLVAVIAIVNVPVYLKIVRSLTLPLRSAEFVEAARASGHGAAGVLFRHILPNTLGPVAAQFSIHCAWSIQIVAGLSFLGLGVRIPEPEWGLMVQQGSSYVVTGQWWVAFFPGMAIVLTVYVFQRFGERAQEILSAG